MIHPDLYLAGSFTCLITVLTLIFIITFRNGRKHRKNTK
jgi:hypothetical protein